MTYEIMMPFYGRVDHFKNAVESVLGQTDPDWKLTVIDDVYPDREPGQWLRNLKDPRIVYIRNTKNLKPSKNYNKCARLSESDYITILGCDDILLPNYVERVKKLLGDFPLADIIQPGVIVIDENGHTADPLPDRIKRLIKPKSHEPEIFSGEELAKSLIRGNWTYFPSLVWRVDLIRGYSFRTDLNVVQDLAMLMEIVTHGGSLLVDTVPSFHYRRHSTSVSAVTGTDGSKFIQEKTLFEECVSTFTELGWTAAAKSAKHHWLSRANALSELPGSLISRNTQGRKNLIQHIFNK